jgi:CheY-like chemotaxis protein
LSSCGVTCLEEFPEITKIPGGPEKVQEAPVSDANEIAQAVFKGCGANVGPLIGTELENGKVTVETASEPPEGELAVLPVACEVDDEPLATLTISSPLNQVATLARRMLGDEEPDKERELSNDDMDAVGEVLNLMSAAVDQAVREHVSSSIRSRPLQWWRTTEPGDNQFEEGEFLLAKGSVSVPGGTAVHLCLRLAPKLLEQGSEAKSQKQPGQVLLVGLEEALQQSLTSILESARLIVHAMGPDSEEFNEICEQVDTILLSGDDGFDMCRQLSLSNHAWSKPTILCMREPTKPKVVEAIEAGAAHVLLVPPEETTLLRVLKAAGDLGD